MYENIFFLENSPVQPLIIERYQMTPPCPSAGNVIPSGVGGFDAMAPGRDVDVRPNNGLVLVLAGSFFYVP